jgi:hypothetical protein
MQQMVLCCSQKPAHVLPPLQITELGSEAIVVGASVSKREDIDRLFKEVGWSHGSSNCTSIAVISLLPVGSHGLPLFIQGT